MRELVVAQLRYLKWKEDQARKGGKEKALRRRGASLLKSHPEASESQLFAALALRSGRFVDGQLVKKVVKDLLEPRTQSESPPASPP